MPTLCVLRVIDELKADIRVEINFTPTEMFEKVEENAEELFHHMRLLLPGTQTIITQF